MKVYIAGPMTGYPEHNFPAFHRAARALRALGLEAVSPAEMDDPTKTHEELSAIPRTFFMRRDFKALLDCDAVLLLHGWAASEGAADERYVAQKSGIPVYYSLEELADATADIQ